MADKKTSRRVVTIGNTMFISLPAHWVREQKIVKGDSLAVHAFQSKLIVTVTKIPSLEK